MSATGTQSYRVIRLKPDTKAAESLSRRVWKGNAKSRSQKNVAGSKVYRHEEKELAS